MIPERSKGAEMVLGLVGAVETDLGAVATSLDGGLARAGFSSSLIEVLGLVGDFDRWADRPADSEQRSGQAHIEDAERFRRALMRPEALAALAVARIRKLRTDLRIDPLAAAKRHVYLLKSLQRPDEVQLLRRVYGPAFVLVAVHAAEGGRGDSLEPTRAVPAFDCGAPVTEQDAASPARLEEGTPGQFGEDVWSTYEQADVFLDATDGAKLEADGERFLQILFNHPFRTPRIDEYGMTLARVAALRSASLNRQVGAAILDRRGAVRALGTNEVPCFGGGAYWEGDAGDQRDFHLERDLRAVNRERDLGDLLRRLAAAGWLQPARHREVNANLVAAVAAALSHREVAEARVMKSLEYGRAVHAEAAAIAAAAQAGTAIRDCTLYTTAFPCYQCARQIVASGITRVVYAHRDSDSPVREFFSDSIAVAGNTAGRVLFEPFVGVSPERYCEFFAPTMPRHREGKPVDWDPTQESPRTFDHPRSYRWREDEAVEQLERDLAANGVRGAGPVGSEEE